MAEEKEVKIKLTGDTTDLDNKVDDSAKNLSGKMDTASKEVADSAKQMGNALMTGLGTVILQISKEIDAKFTEAIRSGLQELTGIDRYTSVIQRTAKAFTTSELENYIGQLQRLTGISDNELRQAMMRSYIITGDMNKAFQATKLAADIGATGLMDVGSSARAISQALVGTTYGLTMLARQLGITVPEGASTSEILTILTDKIGGLGEIIHSKTSGRIENLQLELGDLKEYFGRLTLEGLNPFITTMDSAVQSLNNFIGGAVEGKTALGDFLSGFLGISAVSIKGFSVAGDIFNKFINVLILGTLVGGNALAGLAGKITTSFLPLVGTAGIIGALISIMAGLKSIIPKDLGAIAAKDAAEAIKEETGALEDLSDALEDAREEHRNYINDVNEMNKTAKTVSPEVTMAHQLIGYTGYDLERMKIRLEFTEKINQAQKEGRTEEAKQLTDLMNWELSQINEREAKEKAIENERLEDRANNIKDYIATAKMSEEDKAKYELDREMEKYDDLVRAGKLTEDELAQYKKLKLEEIYKENQKQQDSWARSQLIGVTGKWFEELTGMSFMSRVNKLNLVLDVNLHGITSKGIDDNTARVIGNSIANQLGAQLGGKAEWQ